MFRYLPWFDFFFTEPMYQNGLKFQSDRHLVKVKAPILILHAEDDLVIPIKLGLKVNKFITYLIFCNCVRNLYFFYFHLPKYIMNSKGIY